jgi:hypothetical protein
MMKVDLAGSCAAVVVLAWSGPALAEAPPPAEAPPGAPSTPSYRSGFEVAISAAAVGSFSGLSSDYEDADPYAKFKALGPQLAVRVGGFVTPSVALGAQLSHSHQWTTTPSVSTPNPPADSSSGSSVSATLLSSYVELYPSAKSPWTVGAAAGLGRATFPEFAFTSHDLVAFFYSIELGYELEHLRSSLFAFYRGLVAHDFEREGMSSYDLGIGWRFRLVGPD